MTKRFYAPIDSFSATSVVLDVDESRHARDVLRLSAGDVISVFDGLGREVSARLVTVGKSSSAAEIIGDVVPSAPESPLRLELAAAMLKSDKFDLTVQKGVELGIDRITPLRTARCDVRSKDSASRAARWRKIALEAAKQCGRAVLTQIDDPVTLEEFLSSRTDAQDIEKIMFVEEGAGKLRDTSSARSIRYIIGPEGGWEPFEVELGKASGFKSVTLGGRIMRAETAAIAITALLQNKFGDLN